MRFQVPQFIEVEDKIFGPLTLRQFIYLAGGGGLIFILWSILPFFLAVGLGIPVAAFTLALAFYKVHNRPFVNVLESAFNYVTRKRLYLWKKEAAPAAPVKPEEKLKDPLLDVPRMSQSRLKELAWNLDIKNSAYRNPRDRN